MTSEHSWHTQLLLSLSFADMSITSQSVKTSVQHTIDRFFRKRKQDGDISVELKAQWQQDIDDRRGQKKQREANAADTDVRRRPGRSCHAPTDAEAGQLVWVQFNIMDYSQVLVTLNSAPIAPAIKHTHTWTIEENEDAPSHVWTYQQTVDTVKNSALKVLGLGRVGPRPMPRTSMSTLQATSVNAAIFPLSEESSNNGA